MLGSLKQFEFSSITVSVLRTMKKQKEREREKKRNSKVRPF